ncbi:Uncharacterised protein [uncultured archaeon]|nr:Uncharacterised protein [uncultured archaeon]
MTKEEEILKYLYDLKTKNLLDDGASYDDKVQIEFNLLSKIISKVNRIINEPKNG